MLAPTFLVNAFIAGGKRNKHPTLTGSNRHATAVGMYINSSKTKVMSALIHGEQCQAVLLDGEPLEDLDKFKCLGSVVVANGQGTEEIRSKINLARSAFSRQQSCLWSRREMSLRTKGRVYQAVMRSILLYSCETWPVRVADERMLEVFDNDNIRRILRVRRRDCMPPVELRRRLCLTSMPALIVQRRFRWFGHAARRPEGELIKDLAQTSWGFAEDMGNHDQGRPVTALRTASLRPRTMEKGLGESV